MRPPDLRVLAFDKFEKDTNFCPAIYHANKMQKDVSWDATKITNGCWYIVRAKACKKSEKKPENADENQVVDIFSSGEE